MAFSRRDLPAARAFVDSIVSGGGVGKPRKHPATWSDDYLVRVANAWQRQAARGEPVSLQAARRGPVTYARPGRGEHPRQRHVGPTTGGHESREYRDLRAMRRWIERRIPGYPSTWVQIVAHGEPVEGYDAMVDRMRQAQADNADMLPDPPPPPQIWRILFTGPGGDIDWEWVKGGIHYPDGRRLFETITGYELRWGDAIEDEPDLYDDDDDDL